MNFIICLKLCPFNKNIATSVFLDSTVISQPTSHWFLTPLPGLLLTSDWPWRTIASCWNQLAAMPGTKIEPVSLSASFDLSLRAYISVTLSHLIPKLRTVSITDIMEHLASTSVCAKEQTL